MKKSRIIIAILVVLLGISFGFNLKHSAERNNERRFLLNSVNSSFVNISRDIDYILSFTEYDEDTVNTITGSFIHILANFREVDRLLNQYRVFFNSESLNYGAIPNFDDIARTMGTSYGTFNGVRYNCIMYDNIISENEVLYLSALRDDLARLMDGMQSTVNPPNVNESLTTYQLNNLLRDFFDTWSYRSENSPYYLLRSE